MCIYILSSLTAWHSIPIQFKQTTHADHYGVNMLSQVKTFYHQDVQQQKKTDPLHSIITLTQIATWLYTGSCLGF